MNMERMIQMVIRIVMFKVVNRGVDAGLEALSRRKKPDEAGQPDQIASDDMHPWERQQAESAQRNAEQAKKAMQASRRIGRL